MLSIEKVLIRGFKSFYDPTNIVFSPQGITGIVGPNGCGKSNIADAISWVIGEQKIRLLRGNKMEDVIFQGSRAYPPSNYAEVFLTLSISIQKNKDTNLLSRHESQFPEQVQVEKVIIGRRLYRNGESEYLINNKVSRLRDIQDLFAGTGLGNYHYAIIEQGRVEQILSAKPFDRRILIEEAAGISKFRSRQHTAELKLQASLQNISRLTDIITEIEKQQNSLKRQASRSQRYRTLHDQWRGLQTKVYLHDYRYLSSKKDLLQVSISQSLSLKQVNQTHCISLEDTESILRSDYTLTESMMINERTRLSEIEVKLERNHQQNDRFQEQTEVLDKHTKQANTEILLLNQRYSNLQIEAARLNSELQKIEAEISQESNELSSEEQEFLTLTRQDSHSEEELEALRQKLMESTRTIERYKQLEKQYTDATERILNTINSLTKEHFRACFQNSQAEENLCAISTSLNQKTDNLKMLTTQYQQNNYNLSGTQNDKSKLELQLSSTRHILNSAQIRHQSLTEVYDRKACYSEAVQAVLTTATKTLQCQIPGTLADFINAEPQHEKLIETALHEELQYLLVKSQSDAKLAIEFLRTNDLGIATFITLNTNQTQIESTQPVPDTSSLFNLMRLPEEIKMALSLAMPHLASAALVKNLPEALNLSNTDHNTLYITEQGDRIFAGKLITGGSLPKTNTGILTLRREINQLAQQISSYSTQSAQTENAVAEITQKIAELKTTNLNLDQMIRQSEQQIAVLQEQLQQCQREKERSLAHLNIVEREMTQAEAEKQEIVQKHAHASEQVTILEQTHNLIQQEISQTQELVSQYRRMAEDRNSRLSARRADFAAKTERRRAIQNDLRRTENEIRELQTRIKQHQIVIQTNHLELEQIRSNQQNLESINITTEQAHQQSLDSLHALEEQITKIRTDLLENQATLKSTREEAARQREDRAKLEIELARTSSDIEHLIQSCLNELGENLVAVQTSLQHNKEDNNRDPLENSVELSVGLINSWDVPDEADFDFEAARSRITEIKHNIETIGPVNLLALEELNEISERHKFLKSQKADIESAVADTQAAITEIKRHSRDKFREAFTEINTNFSQTFRDLFGGGQGEMRLLDETDVLESGIEIIAQPPGKRLQNVLLLSGGEKALTALALVIAIFIYRPSPFCLLDEVDAPLDEINVGRFADIITRMSQHTQFLVITHSKRTMEAADTLYGVTMEDPGISKLVSVKLS